MVQIKSNKDIEASQKKLFKVHKEEVCDISSALKLPKKDRMK